MSKTIVKLAKENGYELEDAREPLALHVTAGDIATAERKSPGNCGFAQACRRQYRAEAAYFFRTTAWLQFGNVLVRYVLPISVQKEVIAFDRAGSMEPGDYQLSAPPESLTLEAISARNAALRSRSGVPSKSGKRRRHHETSNARAAILTGRERKS